MQDPASIYLTKSFTKWSKSSASTYLALFSSKRVEGIDWIDQEEFLFCNVERARHLASLLIDDEGKVDRVSLDAAKKEIEEQHYSMGPAGHFDDEPIAHLLSTLTHFQRDERLAQTLNQIDVPNHVMGKRLIRTTLKLSSNAVIGKKETHVAVFSALLTFLRQSVGSCFATAPAISILRENPLRFLQDMSALLATGRLTRVVAGAALEVPLSQSWGTGLLFSPLVNPSSETLLLSRGFTQALKAAKLGERESFTKLAKRLDTSFIVTTVDALLKELLLDKLSLSEEQVETYEKQRAQSLFGRTPFAQESRSAKGADVKRFLELYEKARECYKAETENALLRAWEFTLASMTESKADFATWNLYSSLGLNPEEREGIGAVIKAAIERMLEKLAEEIKEIESKYDHLFATAKYLEGRMRRASEREIGWITADYRIRRQEINRLVSERDSAADASRELASLFPLLMRFITNKFKEYFQEVYDANMPTFASSIFDDRPAGFRLLYKHGRSNSVLWTLIHHGNEFIQALTSFFSAIEVEFLHEDEAQNLRGEVSQLFTTIIMAIKKAGFVELATKRLQKTHRDPHRLPWAYLSGGTISSFLTHYFALDQEPKPMKRWIESPKELLAFYIDSLKDRHKSDRGSLIAFSPTHAFNLQPAYFSDAWQSEAYTYSWIRDRLILPTQEFLEKQSIDRSAQTFFNERIAHYFPQNVRQLIKKALHSLPHELGPHSFSKGVASTLEKRLSKAELEQIQGRVDALLFRHLPLFPSEELKSRLRVLFENMEIFSMGELASLQAKIDALQMPRLQLLSASSLIDYAKGIFIEEQQKGTSTLPLHRSLLEVMQRVGFAYPSALVVGDSNWARRRFGFIVSPSSFELEFCLCDASGANVEIMTSWRNYLNGSSKKEWGFYPNRFQQLD